MKRNFFIGGGIAAVIIVLVITSRLHSQVTVHTAAAGHDSMKNEAAVKKDRTKQMVTSAQAPLDTARFDSLVMHLVHDKPDGRWPVKTAFPLSGALLPYKRIVAYYGNFYTANMGILGETPSDTMLAKLKREVKKWADADPSIPVQPALHYIAVTAQGSPGKNSKYRLRMPFSQIDKALELAKKIDAIVFLDVQVGQSTLKDELPTLEPYLRLPNVHLGIDPEFDMPRGKVPCSVIGTMDAAEINYASSYLAELTHKYNLPPKILVVHRFTQGMVTNYKKIEIRPEVQIVMNMDGWGFPAKKVNSYKVAIVKEPVQFTGFKLFYKNDLTTGAKKLMSPAEVLGMYPSPIYIQYQ